MRENDLSWSQGREISNTGKAESVQARLRQLLKATPRMHGPQSRLQRDLMSSSNLSRFHKRRRGELEG
jgi:hypothetical protein